MVYNGQRNTLQRVEMAIGEEGAVENKARIEMSLVILVEKDRMGKFVGLLIDIAGE